MTTESPTSRWPKEAMVLLAIGFLWFQLFVALIPVWRFGQYYEYGWLVPPIAAVFVLRRRALGYFAPAAPAGRWETLPLWGMAAGTVLLMVFFAALRIVELANLDWRPPMIFHALTVAVLSHLLMLAACGGKASLALFPVTLFAFSAVPYPGRAETDLIAGLTRNVILATREIFHLTGVPVEAVGVQLTLDGKTVAVTEGCSGIRSLQSLLMAGLFFGEFLYLSWRGRFVLVGVAVFCAFVLNIARAYWLAKVRFFEGGDQMQAIHDPAGHTAFAISSVILLIAGSLLQREWGRKTVVTTVKGGAGK